MVFYFTMVGILVNIRSSLNVGSMFRTADGAGMEKLYLCGITPAPVDEYGRERKDLTKTSLGAEKFVAWENIGSTIDTRATIRLIERLKKEGFHIFAVEQSDTSVSYTSIKFSKKKREKTAIMMGYEVSGLPQSVLRHADKILEIPMHGKKESLNVAVTFGIIAFSVIR